MRTIALVAGTRGSGNLGLWQCHVHSTSIFRTVQITAGSCGRHCSRLRRRRCESLLTHYFWCSMVEVHLSQCFVWWISCCMVCICAGSSIKTSRHSWSQVSSIFCAAWYSSIFGRRYYDRIKVGLQHWRLHLLLLKFWQLNEWRLRSSPFSNSLANLLNHVVVEARQWTI